MQEGAEHTQQHSLPLPHLVPQLASFLIIPRRYPWCPLACLQIRLAKVDGPQEMEEALASLASSLPLKPLRDDKAVS